MRTSGMRQFGLAAAFLLTASGIANAGDHAHNCRSADGGYVMNNEQLQAFDLSRGREVGRAIPYKVLRKTMLSKNTGYCIANQAPRGQRRFGYEAETYALQVRFRDNGQSIKAFMICERASSGLPAAYGCDRDVTTLNWTIGRTAAAPGGREPSRGPRWMHNGSRVRIIADGHRRRIEFVVPNERLVRRGVAPGDPVFVGSRDGDQYVGRAYVYSKHCPAMHYNVRGRVASGDRKVVVTGSRPVRNRRCKTAYRQDVRLVFNRK